MTASDDGTARVWRPFTSRAAVVLRGHQREVTDAELGPDGRLVVTASLDGTARVWNARTGKEITVPLAHGGAVRTAAFSPDGARIVTASADQTARIWDTASGKELAVLRGHGSYVGSAAFSPDGKRVVTSSFDRTARVWDATAGEPLFTLGTGSYQVASAALSPTGARIVVTSLDGDPRVLDAGHGAMVSTLPVGGARVVSAAFSADGRDVVTADAQAGVRFWDAATGRLEGSRKLDGDPVAAVPSPDDAHVVSLSVNDATEPPQTTVSLWSRTREEPAATWHLDGRGTGARFDATGRRLVVWTEDDRVVVWDVPSRRRLAAFSSPAQLRSAALSPDGTRVVTAANDGVARIWTVPGGRELRPPRPVKHALAVVSASFSADGSRLLTAGNDQTARIWDVRTGRELVSLRGHGSELASAVFDPDEQWVATAGTDDGTARVWDAVTGQQLAVFHHPHPADVVTATFDRSGRLVLTWADDYRARVFRCETCLPLDDLVRLARSRLPSTRPGDTARREMIHSARDQAAALRRSRVFPLLLLVLALLAIAGSAFLARSAPVGAATGTTEVNIVPSGYGDITVDGAAAPYTCTNEVYAGSGCSLSVPTGTTLTFRATPKPVGAPQSSDKAPNPPVQSEFRGWSRPECPSGGACTVKTADDEEWVVAQFSPVWLEASLNGPGTIDVGSVHCAVDRCVIGLFEAGTRVTVTARPTTAGAATTFGIGCDPYESDLGNGRCLVNMSNVRNFVSVGFDGFEPGQSPPFNKAVTLKVQRTGDGEGQVEGSGKSADLNAGPWKIECGTTCDVKGIQFQTQVRLRAVKSAGSEFERWSGPPCASDDTCTFTVGKYPKVVAVFKKAGSSAVPPAQPGRPGQVPPAQPGQRAARVQLVRPARSRRPSRRPS